MPYICFRIETLSQKNPDTGMLTPVDRDEERYPVKGPIWEKREMVC